MLKRLPLRNFTAFADAEFEFGEGLNVLVGTNGTGKTHVLKAGYSLNVEIRGKPGEGLKGVDIVAGIRPAMNDLTLLEVKDFREDEPGLRAKVRTGEIPTEALLKALHTWGALCLGARHGDSLLLPDLRTAILRPPAQVRVVLFLAQTPIRQSPNERDTRQKEEARRKHRLGIPTKMQNNLKPLGIKSHLADEGDLPNRCGWTVMELS